MSPLWDENITTARATKWCLWRRLIWRALSYAAIALICLVFLAGTFKTFTLLQGIRQQNQEQQALVRDLLRLRATRIYSDYWTCNRVIFQSQEQIVCGVLTDNLSPGYDRYLPYRTMVRAAPHPAYVFPLGLPQIAAFEQKAARSHTTYQRQVKDGYVIYLPVLASRPGT
jgi:hypothetical protein